jgi:hypothetical protein
VAAPGFATYTQTIEVNSKSYAVNLMTGFVEGYTYEEGAYHPGVLLIGDVTGDGVIDDTDRSVLVDAIDTEQSSESDIIATVNSGEMFDVVSQDESWIGVQLYDGSIGYISTEYVSVDASLQ